MRVLAFKSTFKKELKRMSKRGAKLEKLQTILVILQNDKILPERNRPHMLSGEWRGFMECHIEPDWLLIYRIESNTLYLERTGSHSDLFK